MPRLYETSLSDDAWEVIEPLFLPSSSVGMPRMYSTRMILDAIFGKKWMYLAVLTE